MRTPRFCYFDLGNVLLFFDHHQAARQMAALVAGADPAEIYKLVFAGPGLREFETGRMSNEAFHAEFCRRTGAVVARAELLEALSAIFRPNASVFSIVAQLVAGGRRLGVLSNTCDPHWRYVSEGRYPALFSAFSVRALSFEIGAVKPEPAIFAAAAELAGVSPDEIFFADDIQGHVTAARAAGFDAVRYTTTADLVDELRRRGVELNY